jgi:hypothetical protein
MSKGHRPDQPRQRLAPRILLSLVLLLAMGCSRKSQQPDPAPDIRAQLRADPSPARMGEAQLELTITDGQGEPIEGAKVSVRGDMSHAGMVPVFGTAEEVGDGAYTSPFEWTMGGDWIVTVIIELPDGTVIERAIPIQVDAGSG